MITVGGEVVCDKVFVKKTKKKEKKKKETESIGNFQEISSLLFFLIPQLRQQPQSLNLHSIKKQNKKHTLLFSKKKFSSSENFSSSNLTDVVGGIEEVVGLGVQRRKKKKSKFTFTFPRRMKRSRFFEKNSISS